MYVQAFYNIKKIITGNTVQSIPRTREEDIYCHSSENTLKVFVGKAMKQATKELKVLARSRLEFI